MELLYNPDAMSEQEIKATFVARQPLVDELVALVERQPDGAGVQHVIIVAPRGMGKTTALLMVKFALKDRGLANRWHALKFPEESYGINDLADFWLTILGLLASETRDGALRQQAEDLKRQYPKNEDLQEVTLAALKDWRRAHGKRLLLLVENFDQILAQINDERDNARLRDVLMNDGTLMIIGGATTFFEEARAYDQPLYNFFKLYDLTGLQFDHVQDLLCRHATVDGIANFEDTLRSNASRLRTLAYFTGGNPRLVLMLYRIVTQSDLNEVQHGLEKLLDDVTPYYKAKIEILPAQQQKILDHIARVSGVTNEGPTPGEIATAVRLSPNQVSAQLKRLSAIGYVRAANLRGRKAYYALSEPLFAIWYQMRLARDVHQRMGWLVNFLYHWYDDRERVQEAKRLLQCHEQSERAGDGSRARAIVEHLTLMGKSALSTAVAGEVQRMAARGLSQFRRKHLESRGEAEVERNVTELLADIEEGLTRDPRNAHGWVAKGDLLMWDKKEYEQALYCFDRALQLDPNDGDTWRYHSSALYFLDRCTEALVSDRRALDINPDEANAWNGYGVTLGKLGRDTEELACYQQALKLDPQHEFASNNRANVLHNVEDSFLNAVDQAHFEDAHTRWKVLCVIVDGEADKARLKRGVLFAAELGHFAFASKLLAEAGLREEFFPLDRALEYLQTKDEALIEKLSPEIKEAVWVVVNDLRPFLQPAEKSREHPLARAKLWLDDDYIAKRGGLVHKLKAKDSTGRRASYFVLVWKSTEQAFLNALKSEESEESIDLEDYGRVLASNYGEEPREDIRALLKEKYGFNV
ncbi:MAG: hypothetical protein EXR78_06840 [Deltaproteobacteria bacterium]|nr:hypothetical protein [Deltaproteobacteria bacterium]